MAEHRGFTCDEGCGESIVLDPSNPTDSITHHGWYHVFTPSPYPTLTCCSAVCVVEALTNPYAAVDASAVPARPRG